MNDDQRQKLNTFTEYDGWMELGALNEAAEMMDRALADPMFPDRQRAFENAIRSREGPHKWKLIEETARACAKEFPQSHFAIFALVIAIREQRCLKRVEELRQAEFQAADAVFREANARLKISKELGVQYLQWIHDGSIEVYRIITDPSFQEKAWKSPKLD